MTELGSYLQFVVLTLILKTSYMILTGFIKVNVTFTEFF